MKKQIIALFALLLVVFNASMAATYEVPEGETVTFYHTDHLGSPVIATDHNGNLLWEDNYTGYGESTKRYAPGKRPPTSPLGPKDNIGYTGHESVEYTGLVYMKARWYHPKLGRFLQPDPVGFVQSNNFSVNRYAYSNNNPILNTDPNGEWFETAWDIASLSASITSAVFNFKSGNVREGLIDSAFAVVDGAAVLIPGVPGGLGMIRQASREGAEAGSKSLGRSFDVHPRVADQLENSRMGRLQGQLNNDDLQVLANNPNALRVLDNRSGNINIIQEVEGKTVRITIPTDEDKIISVGPIRPNQVKNLLEKGDFTPLE